MNERPKSVAAQHAHPWRHVSHVPVTRSISKLICILVHFPRNKWKKFQAFHRLFSPLNVKFVKFEENCTEFAIFIQNLTMVDSVLRFLGKRYLHGRERNGGIQWTNCFCLDHFIHHLRRFVWGSRGPLVGRLMNEVCYCWVFIGFPGRWSLWRVRRPVPPIPFHFLQSTFTRRHFFQGSNALRPSCLFLMKGTRQ